MFMCEFGIIIIWICQNLGSVELVQQKIKLHSPYKSLHASNISISKSVCCSINCKTVST